MEIVTDFILGGSKITADGDCSHEIKRRLVLGRKVIPAGSDSKESACNAVDLGLISGVGRSLGGGHGNHSSVLAWRIPGTGEPGGLPPMGSHRVGHD